MVARSGAAAAADNAAPRHHREGGFQNNYVDFEPKGLGALLQWRVDALRDGLPKPPRTPTPVVAADLAYLRSNAAARLAMEPAVTWIGHATMLVQAGGATVLTDPIFSQRASPLAFLGPKRHVDPGIALADLPHIDAVVISHNHYDHLDDASVQALAAQSGGSPVFIVPLGLKAWFAKRGIERVVELDWWQSHTVGAVEVVLTPVQHWSGRGLTDRMATLWGGYALFAPDFHVFFAGDTAYSKDFADIRARFAARQDAANGGGFDVALLPIGAYEPRWFMKAAARRSAGGGADPPRPEREAVDRHALGHVRADRRVARPAADRPRRGAPGARTRRCGVLGARDRRDAPLRAARAVASRRRRPRASSPRPSTRPARGCAGHGWPARPCGSRC